MEEKIAKLKKWAEENYNKGADTIVECWSKEDYIEALNDNGNDYDKTLAFLKTISGVYEDRQAGARNSVF